MIHKVLGNKRKGRVFIVSAPAGTGKTTLVDMIKEEFPFIVQSISYTTRKPRGKEVNGVDYFFISHEEFQQKIVNEDFLEYVRLYDQSYGTSRAWVEEQLESGNHVVLVIDTQGAMKLKKRIDSVSIFVTPPSFEELKSRLIERRTDSHENISLRLEWAKKELLHAKYYDYEIVNDDLKIAYDVLRSIFIAEEHRVINYKGESDGFTKSAV